MKGFVRILGLAKPYLAIVFVQFGYAGMSILAKSALDSGMSQFVFVVYRQAVATLVIAPFAIVLDRFLFFPRSLRFCVVSYCWCFVSLGFFFI